MIARDKLKFAFGLGLLLFQNTVSHSAERAGNIIFESSVLPEQIRMIQTDRKQFQTLTLAPNNQPLMTLMGITSLSSDSLTRWLEDRVQVVVGESFQVAAHQFVVRPRFNFANPGLFPVIEHSTIVPKPGVGAVIMSNIGSGIYRAGKSQGQLLGLKLEGIGELAFSSPRTGAIQVGPALFEPKHGINPADPKSIANTIPRMGTLFHEARHSDGNGYTLSFFHAVCPLGHSLQGFYACDRNLNGPYTVGGMMIQAMDQACTQCTAAEHEALRLRFLDAMGRVIPTSADGTHPTQWDPTPEGTRS